MILTLTKNYPVEAKKNGVTDVTWSYTYDRNGNISQVKEALHKTTPVRHGFGR